MSRTEPKGFKEHDSVNCLMVCYRSLSWTDYIQHKGKTKKKQKGKKARTETANVIIRPRSKSKKGSKLTST